MLTKYFSYYFAYPNYYFCVEKKLIIPRLKKKLQLEGLFDDSIKRQLPAYPKNIAVVTSPDGAVIQDIINVLDRRSPFLDLTVVPTLVQGEKAAPLICDALNKVGKLKNIAKIGQNNQRIERCYNSNCTCYNFYNNNGWWQLLCMFNSLATH